MDLYTLNSGFVRQELVDRFTSVVWAERYITPGDITLVVDATAAMISLLSEGTFLSLAGSKEVMLIETQSIEQERLTIKGKSLLKFLNTRNIYSSIYERERYYSLSDFPAGDSISLIVYRMCGDVVDIEDIGDELNEIPNLSLGSTDLSGPNVDIAPPFGPLLDGITPIAEEYHVGMSLYLDSADEDDYSLLFTTYQGLDRTSDQDDNTVVRFSQSMDSLTNIKELRSIDGYKNVCYMFPPVIQDEPVGAPVIAYADVAAETAIGFDRRVLVAFNTDIDEETVLGNPTLTEQILSQSARNALINNNHIKIFDGEVLPTNPYKFGVHYGMGDIVELEGHSGFIQKARVTEYIRSQDATGERAYPTLSIVV
jgi:hypothetical protein